MLIAVAGTIGAGKSTVANAIAQNLKVPLLAVDDDKRAEGAVTPEFDEWVRAGAPFPDWFRSKAFQRTLDRLRAVTATSHDAVVEETFHRKSIRDPFFDQGGALMDGLTLVEVVAAESVIVDRLANRAEQERDHLAGLAMYRAFQEVSDPQDRVDFRFRNEGDVAAELQRCCDFIRARGVGGSAGG